MESRALLNRGGASFQLVNGNLHETQDRQQYLIIRRPPTFDGMFAHKQAPSHPVTAMKVRIVDTGPQPAGKALDKYDITPEGHPIIQ
jgi:hypothetical protein